MDCFPSLCCCPRGKSNGKPTPVLLFTDIGADVDDTEALLVLLGSTNIRVVGVVTSVNNGVARGALVRGWLRLLGVHDCEIPVLPSVDVATAKCITPLNFPSPSEAGLGHVEDTPRRILELAAAYGTDLCILAISPLTPLADALRLDSGGALHRVKRIYFQGSATKDPDDKTLVPDGTAYNFRTDMEAAKLVFRELQDYVPFTFLGKSAAYRVSVTRSDLEKLHRDTFPSIALIARDQMNAFRQDAPDLFYSLYPVPEKHRNAETMDWYDNLPGDVISHPYDPLVALLLAEDAGAMSTRCARKQLQEVAKRAGHIHEAVGNDPDDNGVPDPEGTKSVLMESMLRGINRSNCSSL